MITLTTPKAVSTVLGSATTTSYDRLDIVTLFYDVLNKNISGTCQLIASGTPAATPIQGNFTIPTTGAAVLTISLPTIPFYGSVALNSTAQATVQGWITAAQNQVEAGLINVAVIAGVQSPGT